MPWATTDPAFSAAPGFAGYAPTAAYQYVPTGGAVSPGVFGSGGGSIGSTTTGGGGASTLGGLLSAASGLGTLNSISKMLTDKGLLEHAGIDLKSIPNPLSNFLGGGDGLSLTDMLPDTIKNALNIYPSQGGLLTPGGGTALLTDAQGEAMVNALGGPEGYFNTASPWVNPDLPLTAPPGGTVPPIEPVYGGYELGTTNMPYGSPTAGEFGPYSDATYHTTMGDIQAPAAWQNASDEAIADAVLGGGPRSAPVDPSLNLPNNPYLSGGPTPAPSLGLVGNQVAMANLFPGAVGTSALAAAPGFAALAPGVTAIPSMGGALAGALGPAAAAPAAAGGAGVGSLLGAAGALGPLALAGIGFGILKGMKKDDPFINQKIAADMGEKAKLAMEGDAGALNTIKARLFGGSAAGGEHAGELIKLASSGGTEATGGWQGYVPYGTDPSRIGHSVVGWEPPVAAWYRREMLGEGEGKRNEHVEIHQSRDEIVGRREDEDPLQGNPFVDTTTSRMRTAAESGIDGPIDLATAAKIDQARGGLTPQGANLFYQRFGHMPVGYYDWRNDPSSRFYVDPMYDGPGF